MSSNSLSFPISLVSVTNFLSQLTTRAGEFVSYGSLRMHKATIVNTLKLTKELARSSEDDEAGLKALVDSVKRSQPDLAKYSETFDLDDVLTWLVEDLEECSHQEMLRKASAKDFRARARRRAVVTLKLHGLYRSNCCLQMQRGALFNGRARVTPSSGSRWGPLRQLEDDSSFPEWVILRLSKTKTSGSVEDKILLDPSEPALCPVANLFTYVQMCVKLGDIAPFAGEEHSIFLGTTKGTDDRGKKCYKPLTSADPIAKDTLEVLTAAGVDEIYKAHSLRHASASRLLQNGVEELDIIKHARWSSTSVFRKFYERSQHKQICVADLRAKIDSTDKSRPAKEPNNCAGPVNIVEPTESPNQTPVSPEQPRINFIFGPRGGKQKIPGQQSKNGEICYCSCCWDKADSTMIWCRDCNKHMHRRCFLNPDAGRWSV